MNNYKRIGEKGIALEFVVRLVIALVLLIGAIFFVQRLLAGLEGGKGNFDEFVMKLGALEEGGAVQSFFLEMDRGEAIVGFISDKNELRVEWGREPLYRIKRPNECPQGEACVCDCVDDLDLKNEGGENVLSCKGQLKCKLYPLLNFESTLPKAKFIQKTFPEDDYTFYGGFIIRRSKGSFPELPGIKDKIALYLKREQDKVTICDHNPC